jgi:ribosomal protein S18 acetylase RimI-like enzyme
VSRPSARVEEHGPLRLFVKQGAGWPYYARPALPSRGAATVADVLGVRARQRELGIPEAFEWVPETTPWLLGPARAAGLQVLEAPLMVLGSGRWRTPEPPPGVVVRRLEPGDPALAAAQGAVRVAFAHEGTARGEAGAAERDAAAAEQSPEELARIGERMRRGLTVTFAAEGAGGVLAAGTHQPIGDVSEIVGVGTLPSARRRGLGALVTAHVAADARERGAELVFLAAGSEAIARVYARLGFERVGTACIASAEGTPAP